MRHGATDWSEEGRHTGRTEVPLNDRGRAEAQRTGALLDGRKFALVLVSPQDRAQETCALLGYLGQARTVEDLVEWDYGDYDGLTDAQTRERSPGWSLLRDGAPGGESPADVRSRVARVLASLESRSGPALLVSHGKTLRVLAATWLGHELEFAEHLPFDAGALSVLDSDDDSRVLRLWNLRA